MVQMMVADELLDTLADAVLLMKAREVAHAPAEEAGYTLVTLVVDGAPETAKRVEPVFQRTQDGIRVLSMNWQY
jgi:hypothetical protein